MKTTKTALRVGIIVASLVGSIRLSAQTDTPSAPRFDEFLEEVMLVNPRLNAASGRATSLRAAAAASGALPDPRLMIGVASVPVASPGFDDMMTMKQVGISQMIPFPGKRGLEREAANYRVEAGVAGIAKARSALRFEVAVQWAALARIDAELEILRHRRDLLVGLRDAAESAYRAGSAGQDAVWQSRLELSQLALSATALQQQREAGVAALNVMRDQPAATAIGIVTIPDALLKALVDTLAPLQFDHDSLGAALIDAAVPPIDTLVAWAAVSNPEIAEHVARLAEQNSRVALARQAARPDLEFSLMYEQRDDLPDFFSASVAIPLAIRKGRVQGRLAEAAEGEWHSLHAEHEQMLRDIEAELVGLRNAARTAHTTLAILDRMVIPERQAALEAAQAGFAAGRIPFTAVLTAEQGLYADLVQRHEQLSAFMVAVASIEAVVGREIFS